MSARKQPFTKMHGLGNDYIYINCLTRPIENPEELSRRLSDRHFGIGADGLVLILPSTRGDFRMRMFNADGSEAQMCGNAVRCVAKYLFERGITKHTSIKLETKAGIRTLDLTVKSGVVESVTVNMGEPILTPERIPVEFSGATMVAQSLPGIDPELKGTAVSMGNPHIVFFVPEITDQLVLEVGPKIERHPSFPERVNVEFVTVKNRGEMTMRVWERGSGETWACGTGAAAVCVAAVLNNLTDRSVLIHLRGGDLKLRWGDDNHVYKTGPATFVFDGEVEI